MFYLRIPVQYWPQAGQTANCIRNRIITVGGWYRKNAPWKLVWRKTRYFKSPSLGLQRVVSRRERREKFTNPIFMEGEWGFLAHKNNDRLMNPFGSGRERWCQWCQQIRIQIHCLVGQLRYPQHWHQMLDLSQPRLSQLGKTMAQNKRIVLVFVPQETDSLNSRRSTWAWEFVGFKFSISHESKLHRVTSSSWTVTIPC